MQHTPLIPFVPRPYQEKGVQSISELLVKGYRKLVFQMATGSGKCLGFDTEILMFDGTIKKVQDITKGDVLMGPDSTPRNVLSTCIGEEMMYKITPVKGDPYVVNESHILSLKITGSENNKKYTYTSDGKKYGAGDIVNISVTDYLKSSSTFKHCAKGWRTGVYFFNKYSLKIPPYILGIWLGDGTSLRPEITSIDSEVIDSFTEYSVSIGNEIRIIKVKNLCATYVSIRKKGEKGKNVLTEKLTEINVLGNKHIPNQYKTASYFNRLDLLAGLLDTDGYLHHGHFEIVTKFDKLGQDILFLARSLGFAAYGNWQKKTCTNTGSSDMYFRITISGDVSKIPTKVKRRIAEERQQKKNVLLTGISVEPIGIDKYYGFELDGDGLFMLGDFTVTHNTKLFSYMSNRFIQRYNFSVLIMVHRKELLRQTRDTLYQNFGIDCEIIRAGSNRIRPAQVYVCMVESLKTRINKIPSKIGMVIIDEAHERSFNKMHDFFPAMNGSTTKEFAGTGMPYIIGFTATPLSSSKKDPMKDHYQEIVCGIDIEELIRNKFLCQNITYTPKDTVDRSQLVIKNGKFDKENMSQAFSKPKYVEQTVKAYEKYAPRTKALIFNCDISHSIKVMNAFKIAGYDCRHIDSEMETRIRDNNLRWFSTTPGAILCNVGIATTGNDIPSIETIIMNKSTLSMPHWIQTSGRGGRPFPNKEMFSLIDMGGNALAHGDWCDKRDWYNIFHNPPKPKEKEGVAPVKSCPQCDAIVHASARVCSHCGFVFPVKAQGIEEELSDFVVVTKGIDVHELINKNRTKKQYYSFYKIGHDLAEGAKNTIPKMTDESANFILHKYDELAEIWCQENGKEYTKWHKDEAKKNLFMSLMDKFKGWKPEGFTPPPPTPPTPPPVPPAAGSTPIWQPEQYQVRPILYPKFNIDALKNF